MVLETVDGTLITSLFSMIVTGPLTTACAMRDDFFDLVSKDNIPKYFTDSPDTPMSST